MAINPQKDSHYYESYISCIYKKFEMELADLNSRHDRLEANMKKILERLQLER